MLILGLTGSIGMGKSTIAGMLRARGIDVFDADAEVHRLYEAEAVPLVEAAFPGTTTAGKVDRLRLAAALGNDATQFRKLEAIVHPLVRQREQKFLDQAHDRGASVAVLEIPLLFETGLNAHVDAVLVASAPGHMQRQRVLERIGMTDARLSSLLEQQLSDAEKRSAADFVVETGGSLAESEAQVDTILAALKSRPAEAYARHWRS